ncbi:CBS domain-containing membrane protein [Methylobacter tundripaludum]|jgi:CBS domain-containing membrane protein|uniref:CBS domain-containing membrane protein n=2 Tax=Methylobacter TaxID=429 RepID=A0A2S6HGS6_9GAMM|nr:HPP family protein [Methylobacter tundripaludum]PPK76660.1 CBS domain-containing membrane protein [Methylobacter tundripaludum]
MINISQLVRFITVDPVNLSLKGKLLSVISSFSSILIMALVTQKLSIGTAYPIIVASMGASAVILFIIPNSPLAQPWSFFGGQLISAIIGVACAQWFTDIALASACAVGGSIFAMLLLRCLHPPGAATAIAPILSGDPISSLGYGFVLMPVGLNVLIMLVMAILINRWLLRHDYPTVSGNKNIVVEPAQQTGISDQDLKLALENMDMFMDVSAGDLRKLLTDAEARSFKRFKGNITCADIMVRDVPVVEYGTEVEEAWKIMHQQKLKAMPVIDRARRVIGIITWNDFFKFINLSAYESFQDRFRAFIRRTPDVSTDKPESVGHMMTTSVTVLPESAHIADLISLMSTQGYRQIPIVNSENRLVGMVYQANLIAALYDEQLSSVAGQL